MRAQRQRRPVTKGLIGTVRIAATLGVLAMAVLNGLVPAAGAADMDLSRFADLREISSFTAITVSLHRTDTESVDSTSRLTKDNLEAFLRQRSASYFPGIPYRVSGGGDQESAGSPALLGCRVWIDSSNTPSVFQVRCHISTLAHRNIIEDGSFGYGPPDKVLEIVQQQMDHILGGFGGIYARLREGS